MKITFKDSYKDIYTIEGLFIKEDNTSIFLETQDNFNIVEIFKDEIIKID